jgi:hypothetical protein
VRQLEQPGISACLLHLLKLKYGRPSSPVEAHGSRECGQEAVLLLLPHTLHERARGNTCSVAHLHHNKQQEQQELELGMQAYIHDGCIAITCHLAHPVHADA